MGPIGSRLREPFLVVLIRIMYVQLFFEVGVQNYMKTSTPQETLKEHTLLLRLLLVFLFLTPQDELSPFVEQVVLRLTGLLKVVVCIKLRFNHV